MTTTTSTPPVATSHRPAWGWAVSDALAITKRNLITLVRLPQLIVFSTIQPVIFVLLFRYVFGGAIKIPGVPYVDYLMPGIFVQTVAFGSISTGIGLAEDLHKGLIERFRSLPMARSAVLAGRTLADLIKDVFVVALMCAVGFAVGFRVHTNAFAFLGGMALVLLFGFSLTWALALIGLSAGNSEGAQAASFPVLAPLVFASSAFVPPETMPTGCASSPSTSRSPSQWTPYEPWSWAGRPSPKCWPRSPGARASSRCSPRWPCAATAGQRRAPTLG